MPVRTPPALHGVPLLGNALEFRRDPVAVVRRGYQRFGLMFSIRLGPQPIAVVLGPAGHRFFFEQTDTVLSLREVYKFVVPMFGEVLQSAEPQMCSAHRNLLHPAFGPRALASFVNTASHETLAWLQTLGDTGEFELWPAFEQLSMNIAAAALLGVEAGARMGSEFWQYYRDLAGGMEFVLPTNLPLPRFRRRDRAKAKLFKMIDGLVSERRAGSAQGHLLQTLVDARYADGSAVPRETVAGMILASIFAAYDTTAAQTSWALIQLIGNPSWLTQVLNELHQHGSDTARTDVNVLRRLRRLEWALKETVRMKPITTMLWRYTAMPYELHGYEVPRGWITMICPPVSHRLPEVFPNPDLYQPERFSPERGEDRSDPFALANFGGGAHRCLGMQFAFHEMKVILSLLLTRYELELDSPDPLPDYGLGIMRPAAPCIVKYRRRPPIAESNSKEESWRMMREYAQTSGGRSAG
jgi:sterol 14-demethylase